MSDSVRANCGNVYVVDDDPAMAKLVATVLQASGFAVTSFSSAEDFLLGATEFANACLILDLGMPSMGGAALQEEINRRGIELPIVFLSGIADIPIATKLIKRGAINVLEKPFQDADLIQAATEAISVGAQIQSRSQSVAIVRARIDSLTVREKQVLHLIAKGLLNKQIGLALELSERTIEIHRGRVMKKMVADSIAGLIMQYAIIFPDGDAIRSQAA